MAFRLDRLRIMGPWYGRALFVVALAFPIGIGTLLLQDFAGKETNLNVSLVASISFGANLAMGASLLKNRGAMREQREELNRLRGTVEAFERLSPRMMESTKSQGSRR